MFKLSHPSPLQNYGYINWKAVHQTGVSSVYEVSRDENIISDVAEERLPLKIVQSYQ